VADNREFFSAPVKSAIEGIMEAKAKQPQGMPEEARMPDAPTAEGAGNGGANPEPWSDLLAQAEAAHYGFGDTVEDHEEAARLYEQAARLGSGLACLERGQLCLSDEFGSDERAAIKWFSELPRPKGRGFLFLAIEERQLVLTLTPDIATHRLGCHLVPYRGHVIPVRPKLPLPKNPPQFGKLGEHLPCCDALDHVHHLGRRQPRRCLHEEVNMVLHDFHLHDGHGPLPGDALQQVFEIFPPERGQEPLAILRDPHEVVLEIVSCAHAAILASRKRLSSPARHRIGQDLNSSFLPAPRGGVS